jgi:hypothetical protein
MATLPPLSLDSFQTAPSSGGMNPAARHIPHKIINAYIANGRIFASIETGIYCSADCGRTFSLLRDFPGATYGLRCIFVDSKGSIFVSPEGPRMSEAQEGLWRSTNSGAVWERVLELRGEGLASVWGFAEGAQGALFAGAYTRGRNITLAVVYRSNDGGQSWSNCYTDPTGRHVHAISFDPWQNAVYVSVGDDFGKWKTKRVVRSLDGGESWTEILTAMPQVVPIIATPAARLFGSDQPGITCLYRTIDDEHFDVVRFDDRKLYFFWLRREASGGRLFASGVSAGACEPRATIYRSIDDGLSWHDVWQTTASAINDGAAYASNVEQNMLLAQVRSGGKLQHAVLFNLL